MINNGDRFQIKFKYVCGSLPLHELNECNSEHLSFTYLKCFHLTFYASNTCL